MEERDLRGNNSMEDERKYFLRAIISCVWICIWSTPFVVAIMGNSRLMICIGCVWTLIMYVFTIKVCPAWLLTAWERFFNDDEE